MIFILDKKEEIVGVLSNTGDLSKTTPYFDDLFTEDLETASSTFEVTTLGHTKEAHYLQVGNYLAFKDEGGFQLFQITEVTEEHSDTLLKTAYCEGVCMELINEVIRPVNIPSTNIKQLLTTILENTGWNVGMVDIALSDTHTIEITEYTNVYKALQDYAIGTFGAELRFRVDIQGNRIVAKYIDVFAQRGRTTKHRFEYGVNMTNVKKTVDTSELCTALIGVGNSNITFKSVSADDKPLNQDFIIDQDAYDRWNNKGSHITGVYKAETDSPDELLYLTRKELKRRSEPKITYEMDVELLGSDVRLGDEVFVIDTDFVPNMLLSARVSVLEKSKTGETTCKLANFKEVRSNITSDVRDLANQLQGEIENIVNGSINSKFPVTSENIQDGAVTSDKIGQEAISSTHISSLSADKITTGTLDANLITVTNLNANSITTGSIDAKLVNVKNLNASNITTGTLDASKINVTNVNADNITSGSINASIIDVSNLNANNITSGIIDAQKINVTNINASNVTTGTLDATKIDVKNLSANSITTGTIDASKINVSNINASNITSGSINASVIGVTNLNANNITTGSIDASVIDVSNLNADNITTGTIDASNVNVTNLSADSIATGTLDARLINVINLNATNITTGTIDASKIKVTNLSASSITTGSLDASKVTVKNLSANSITTGSIDASKINVINLSANNITSGSISSDRLNVKDGFITSAMISNGAIGTAHIVDGSISSLKVANGSITNAKIQDATIDSAKIKSINAEKITTGTIDTGKITISGVNGKLRMTNNRLQVFDAQSTPVERVAIGDVNNDGSLYGLRVRGADGNTVLYDENGVYSEGITDGAITNPKIADESITGNKLVIDDIFANTGFVGALKTVSLDASQITTGQISGERVDITGLISFDAFDSELKKNFVHDSTADKTFINGGNIYTKSISADKINAKGLVIEDAQKNITFAISETGDTDIKGTLTSFNYVEGKSGYKLTPTGDAYLNNAVVRGSVILPNGGLTDDGTGDKSVRFWGGANYENRDAAPFRVLQDGTVIATKGEFNGTVTGSIDIGNIRIEDTNSTNGSITLSSNNNAKEVIKLQEDASFIDTTLIIGNTNNKVVEFDKANRSVNMTDSTLNITTDKKYLIFPNNSDDVLKMGYSGSYGQYAHSIKYDSGSMVFHSTGAIKEGSPHYKFTRADADVEVEVNGDLTVKNKITINNKIEMVSRTTTDNNSGFDFIIK
jgi:phage minor structural protein